MVTLTNTQINVLKNTPLAKSFSVLNPELEINDLVTKMVEIANDHQLQKIDMSQYDAWKERCTKVLSIFGFNGEPTSKILSNMAKLITITHNVNPIVDLK